MVLPLVPVAAALNAGGHLVAHSAGGLIVYSTATGGYVAGTYISTAALASFLTGSAVAIGAAGTAAVSGAAIWAYGTVGGALASIIGSAGIFGTTVGAKGIIGFLMSIGVISAVSIIYPIMIGILTLLAIGLFLFGIHRAWSIRKLRKKVVSATGDAELQFTQREATLVERIIRSAARPHSWLWKKWMQFFGRKRGQA